MSLFNRPAWAKSQTTTTDADESGANIFSHSGRSYREIVAEQERKKQAKLERKKLKEERRSSGKHETKIGSGEAGSTKRRRISLEEDQEDLCQADLTLERSTSVEAAIDEAEDPQQAPQRRSPRHNKHVDLVETQQPWASGRRAEVVDLGDSDVDEDVTITAIKPPAELIDDESDDEFAELARRAREARQQTQQQTKKSRKSDEPQAPSSNGDPNVTEQGQSSLPTPPPDPTIQIFISSRLPETKPMIVYRRLSQNIAQIRRAWCQRQGFSEEATKDIFFIHGIRRVYDVTTCRSLGLEVDSFGNVTLKGVEGKEDVDKVHLEAVNDILFRQIIAEKAQESRTHGDEASADAGEEHDSVTVEHPQEGSFIRLLLKAKGKDDFKLKVKPTTTFSKIAAAYAKTRLTENQTLYLAFDGERLDPDDEVHSTDISDMDCIEVHISPS